MRISIDTISKTIEVEQDVKLKDLIKNLKSMFPNREWEEFSLKTTTTIQNWSYPIYYPTYIEPTPQKQWWDYPYYCRMDSVTAGTPISESYKLAEGTFNVQC
jgi:hypothetical protein